MPPPSPARCWRFASAVLFSLLTGALAHAATFSHPGLQFTNAQLDAAQNPTAIAQITNLANQLVNEPANAVAVLDVPGYFQDPTTQQTRVKELQADVRAAYVCALAYQLTGNLTYAATARRLVLAWVDKNTIVTGYDGPIVMTYLGVGLLTASDLVWDTFTSAEAAHVRTWAYYVYYLQAANPEQTGHTNNHRAWGIWGGIAVAYLRSDAGLLNQQVTAWKSYVTGQIASDGSMPEEIARGSSAGWYTYFGLAPALSAAQAVFNCTGESLWDYNSNALRRALGYLYTQYANPDRLGAGSSCNPENLFVAARRVYPNETWATASYSSPSSPIDASNDQHVAWEFPSLLPATRTLPTATPPDSDSAGSTSLVPTWLTDAANSRYATFSGSGAALTLAINDASKTLGAIQNSLAISTAAGGTWRLTFNARRRSSTAINVALAFLDGSGRVLRSASVAPNLGNWTPYTLTQTAPSGTATVQVRVSSGTTSVGATELTAFAFTQQ